MDETFASVLGVGGRSNSLGRAGEVLAAVLDDTSRLDELVDCLEDEDAWVRMRAADTLEKLARVHPDRLTPYVDELAARLHASPQASIQWHLAQVYAVVDLDDRQLAVVVAWLEGLLATTQVDWIVASHAMQTFCGFARDGRVDVARVRLLCEGQVHHRSTSVRRRAGRLLASLPASRTAVTLEEHAHVEGPFFHGTAARLAPGDQLVPGRGSTFQPGRTSNNIYFAALVGAAVWGAELSVALTGADGRGHVYVVEPLGAFEDDPNVTDKKFPGNPTQSYRSREPLRVVSEFDDWEGHHPDELARMLAGLAALREQGLDVIED